MDGAEVFWVLTIVMLAFSWSVYTSEALTGDIIYS